LPLITDNPAYPIAFRRCAGVAGKSIRDLKLDRQKVNVNSGAIALSQPIGVTGPILIARCSTNWSGAT
jgi:hypothetical protein